VCLTNRAKTMMRNIMNINKFRNYESCGSKCVESRICISTAVVSTSISLVAVVESALTWST